MPPQQAQAAPAMNGIRTTWFDVDRLNAGTHDGPPHTMLNE
jgi:hypothetical protein